MTRKPQGYLLAFGHTLSAPVLAAINTAFATEAIQPLASSATQADDVIPIYPEKPAPEPNKPEQTLQRLRLDLRTIAESHRIDLALQSVSERETGYRLACFDMDSTLIEQEVIDEIAKAAGIGAQVTRITEAAMRGDISFNESFIRRLGLLKDFPASELPNIAQNLRFSPGAVALFQKLRQRNIKTAIFSGGFSFFAKGLQAAGLGDVDFICSNDLEIIDGKLTGKTSNPIVNESRKAELIEYVAIKLGIPLEQSLAVGDGANDIPMLKRAGLGIAYRAKPIVRENTDFHLNHARLDQLLALLPESKPRPRGGF